MIGVLFTGGEHMPSWLTPATRLPKHPSQRHLWPPLATNLPMGTRNMNICNKVFSGFSKPKLRDSLIDIPVLKYYGWWKKSRLLRKYNLSVNSAFLYVCWIALDQHPRSTD
jgi:hypothetical protein